MTTPVGSIRLDLSIDGSDLDDQITAAVQKHMEPVMARLHQQLERIERDYDDAARAAERSAAKQTAANAAVADSVQSAGNASDRAAPKVIRHKTANDGLANSTRTVTDAQNDLNAAIEIFGRKSPQVTAAQARLARAQATHTEELVRAAARSKTSTDSQVRDYERLARAAEESAARQAAAAEAARAGGGGGGGGRGGNRVSWHGGSGGFLGSPVGLSAIALGVGSFPAAATAAVNLTGALQQLIQVGGVVPGMIAGIVSSVGTAALGFHGLSDAVKESWKAASSGDPKDLKKAAEAMQGLAPAAQSAVKAIVAAQPQLERLERDIVQQNMFDGVDKVITDLTNKSMPTFERGLGGIAKSWNATFKELGRVGGLDSSQSILDKVFGNTAEAQSRANAAIEPLIHGIGTLTAESSDFLPRLADGLAAVTSRFDRWITRSVENGNLDKWINQGIEGFDHLGNTLLNIGKIIASITKAAGGDGGLLTMLDKGSGALADLLASDRGQEKLIKFFTEGREQIGKWLPILGNVATILGQAYDGAKQWSDFLLPILKTITDVLASMPGGISSVVTAFLAWRSISGVASLLGMIGGIGGGIDALPGKANTAAGGISRALSRIAIPAVLGPLLASQTGPMIGPDQSAGSNLGGLAANVGGGAAIGATVAGVPGAIVGAIVGMGTSIYQRVLADIEKGQTEWEQHWQQQHDTGPREGEVGSKDPKTGLAILPGAPPEPPKPMLGDALRDFVNSGGMPGFTIGPDGSIVGAGGKTVDGIQLPPATVIPPAAPPPVPVPEPPPPTQQNPLPVFLTNAVPPAAVPQNLAPPALPPVTGGNGQDLGKLFGVGTLPAFDAAAANVQKLATDIKELPEGEVKIKDPSPELMKNLDLLDTKITQVGENEIQVKANTRDAQASVDALILQYKKQTITLLVQAQQASGQPVPLPPGRADGGVLPGWSPGVDNMLVPMSGGEGVLIPEAVRALGGAAGIYAINSRFRSGLSRQGYADGGVVGVGGVPGIDDNSELGVLRQIRDLLAGKGGGPLPATSDAITSLASDTSKAGVGTRMGPFGTPIKARNPAYDAAAAAIQALGGDPEKWIGMDPSTYAPTAGVGGVGAGGVPAYGRYAELLSAFAKSGNLNADLTGAGLDANDPVIRAITTARNRKRGALGGDAIAGLVEQVIGGGGFTGTLDSSNSTLVAALQTFREKLGRGTAGSVGALPAGSGPRGSKTGLQPNASQLWDVIAQQFPEVRDIGGVRADRIADHPSGRALDIMVGQDQALGDRINQYLRDNAAALGLDSTIWRDQWADFNGNTSMVPGHQDHIHAKVAAGAATGLAGLQMPGAAAGLGGAGGGVVPVYVTNFDGQMRGIGGQMLGALGQAGGQAASDVSGDVMSAVAGLGQEPWNTKKATYAELNQLVKERNPLAVAKALGLNVQDFTRQGGDGGDLTTKDGPAFDANGRMFSDTGALLDRTFTSVNAQLNAMREQLVDVLEQTSEKLNKEALEPVVKSGVQSAIEGLKDSVSNSIGTALGQAAAPPIADAVRSAIPADSGNGGGAGGGIGSSIAGAMFATGGGVSGGVPGKDSVPALLMPGEHVFTTDEVARMGGQSGVYAFRAALRTGGFRRFATGGGVNVNDTVGAEFFGVSQVPILGAIVNLLVRVLLGVLGVEIEARDTLNEMTDEFRQFRGDFEAFDASGRLMNDTSALVDRSSTSEEEAAQERIRILKIVIQALIKYIIEKVIVPIAKAVANAALSAGGAAAGAGVNSVAPGAGGIVSALITSGGSAGVDVLAEVGSEIAVQASAVIVDMVAQGLQSYFPDAVGAIFGGGLMENLIAAPITGALEAPLAIIGALTGALSGLFTPLLAIFGSGAFDQGGVARGVGMMPKATIRPERVLSPQQTVLFERMISALERSPGGAAGGSPTYVNAEINVAGGAQAGENVRAGLLELMS